MNKGGTALRAGQILVCFPGSRVPSHRFPSVVQFDSLQTVRKSTQGPLFVWVFTYLISLDTECQI